MKKMFKKVLTASVAAGIMSAMMVAGVAADDPTTIEMWYHISPDQATVLLDMIDQFQEENPDIKVENAKRCFFRIKETSYYWCSSR